MTTIEDTKLMADAERNLARLAAENARFKVQLRQLRNRLRPGRAHRVIEAARQDSKTIMHHRFAHLPASRRALAELGIVSPYKFGWSMGLLGLSGLRSFHPQSLEELDAALRRIDARADGLLSMAPEQAMQRLRASAGTKYARQSARYPGPVR